MLQYRFYSESGNAIPEITCQSDFMIMLETEGLGDMDFRKICPHMSLESDGRSNTFQVRLEEVTLAQKHDSRYNKVEISLVSSPDEIANEGVPNIKAVYEKIIPADIAGVAKTDYSNFMDTFSSDYDGGRLPGAESYSAPYFKFWFPGNYMIQYRFYSESDSAIPDITCQSSFSIKTTVDAALSDFRPAGYVCVDTMPRPANTSSTPIYFLPGVSLAEKYDASYNRIEISLLIYPAQIDVQGVPVVKKFVPVDRQGDIVTDPNRYQDIFDVAYAGSRIPNSPYISPYFLFNFRGSYVFQYRFYNRDGSTVPDIICFHAITII